MDPRTAHMTVGALVCRGNRGIHRLPALPDVLPVALAEGQRVQRVTRVCDICGFVSDEVYTVPKLNLVSREGHYPEGYLKHPRDLGNGRIPRDAALEALGDRLWPEVTRSTNPSKE